MEEVVVVLMQAGMVRLVGLEALLGTKTLVGLVGMEAFVKELVLVDTEGLVCLLTLLMEVKQPVSRPNHHTMVEEGTPFDVAAVVPSMEFGQAEHIDEAVAVVVAVSTEGIPGSLDHTEVVVGHYCYIQVEELDHIEVEAVDILQDSHQFVQGTVGAFVVERQHGTMVPESSHSSALVQVFVKERRHSWIG
jgi:hypothetical protein